MAPRLVSGAPQEAMVLSLGTSAVGHNLINYSGPSLSMESTSIDWSICGCRACASKDLGTPPGCNWKLLLVCAVSHIWEWF